MYCYFYWQYFAVIWNRLVLRFRNTFALKIFLLINDSFTSYVYANPTLRIYERNRKIEGAEKQVNVITHTVANRS